MRHLDPVNEINTMSNANTNFDNEIREALRNFIKADPWVSGWNHMTAQQAARKSAASRKLNTVLRKWNVDRCDAFMKYGPNLF